MLFFGSAGVSGWYLVLVSVHWCLRLATTFVVVETVTCSCLRSSWPRKAHATRRELTPCMAALCFVAILMMLEQPDVGARPEAIVQSVDVFEAS